MILIYGIICFIATFIGSIVGIGGGFLTKPLFDLLNYHDIQTISILAMFSILTAALMSCFRRREEIKALDKNIILLLVVGSFVGGQLGSTFLDYVLNVKQVNAHLIHNIQSVGIISILLLSIYMRFIYKSDSLDVNNRVIIFCLVIFFACLSSFLTIGGGILNIVILTVLMNIDQKTCSHYSIIAIVATQFSILIRTILFENIFDFDAEFIPMIIFTSLMGGLIGTQVLKLIDTKYVTNMFLLVLLCSLFINIINIFVL